MALLQATAPTVKVNPAIAETACVYLYVTYIGKSNTRWKHAPLSLIFTYFSAPVNERLAHNICVQVQLILNVEMIFEYHLTVSTATKDDHTHSLRPYMLHFSTNTTSTHHCTNNSHGCSHARLSPRTTGGVTGRARRPNSQRMVEIGESTLWLRRVSG